MGDIADLMINGDMCQTCGELLDGNGFPQFCDNCKKDSHIAEKICQPIAKNKVFCTDCGKRVRKIGYHQHMQDKHGVKVARFQP